MEKMMSDVNRFRNSIKNWWVYVILGALFLCLGVTVFFHPGEMYMALVLTFGLMVIISGISQIYLGANTPPQHGKGWLIGAGVIEILLGVALTAMPAASAVVIPFLLGFWLMFRGFMTIGAASDMMSYGIKGAGWMIFFAILVILCSFIVLINPVVGAGALVIWLGLSLVFAGVSMIVGAFYLLRLKKMLK